MQKPIRILKSFAEAKAAEMEYYRSLSPAERIQIVLWLRERYRISHGLTDKFQRVCRVIKLSDSINEPKESETLQRIP